jgi:hypothetical protein
MCVQRMRDSGRFCFASAKQNGTEFCDAACSLARIDQTFAAKTALTMESEVI